MPRLDHTDWQRLAAPTGAPLVPPRRVRFLPHAHSWRLRHHRHTHYGALLGLVALTGIGLAYATAATMAATGTSTTQEAATTVPVPTITQPAAGARQAGQYVTMSGACGPGTYVLATRNDIFAGSTACADGGRYQLEVTLVPGANTLAATATTAGGTSSAASPTTAVAYDADTTSPGTMLLRAGTAVQITRLGLTAQRAALLSGGAAPYTLKWDYGDGTSQTVPAATAGDLLMSHLYRKAGNYTAVLQVDDAAGRASRLSLATGVIDTAAAVSTKTTITSGLLSAWPVYVALAILILAFYLGEWRETRKLRRAERAALMA